VNFSKSVVRNLGKHVLAAGLLGAACAGIGGCAVEVASPPPYYYRTRLVYTDAGPVYVRERVYVGAVPPPPPAYAGPAPVAESPAAQQLNPLVAPIALYPDPLIAVVLPASTFPQQLQDANAFLKSNPPPGAIDAQPWDPSVKAVAHYPTVVAQLAADPQWTQSLGSAFTNQPADVMAAIQGMRAQASASGSLTTTPQQVVVQDAGVIAIEPATPDLIYVPTYDPVVVYVGYHPLFFGGVGFAVGPWFAYGCNWGGGVIFVGDWHGGYFFRGGHWGRDYAWRGGEFHAWARDGRFGPPPHIDRGHYALAHDVRGREAEFHHAAVAHATPHSDAPRPADRGGHSSEHDRSEGAH